MGKPSPPLTPSLFDSVISVWKSSCNRSFTFDLLTLLNP